MILAESSSDDRLRSTSGAAFVSKAIPVVVPANSFHPVTIAGRATESGILTIRGCVVQAPGGASREFVLPLATDEEEERRSRRRSAIECETGRSKHSGLNSRPWEKSSNRGSTQAATSSSTKSTIRFIECSVVPEQPLLRIRRTSLTHGAVMLYNGEMLVCQHLHECYRANCEPQVNYPYHTGERIDTPCRPHTLDIR